MDAQGPWRALGIPLGASGTLDRIQGGPGGGLMGAQAGRERGPKVPRGIKGGITNKDEEQEDLSHPRISHGFSADLCI